MFIIILMSKLSSFSKWYIRLFSRVSNAYCCIALYKDAKFTAVDIRSITIVKKKRHCRRNYKAHQLTRYVFIRHSIFFLKFNFFVLDFLWCLQWLVIDRPLIIKRTLFRLNRQRRQYNECCCLFSSFNV